MRSFWKHYWTEPTKQEIAFDDLLSNEKVDAYLFPDIPKDGDVSYAEYSISVIKKMGRAVDKLYDELGVEQK